MSLYNLLFGVNQDAGELLKMLNLTTDDFGRFRDAHLNEDGRWSFPLWTLVYYIFY